MPVATGILGGTPVVPQRPTQYKVTAESRFSTVTSTLTIEVLPKARAEEAKANEELDVLEMIMVRRNPRNPRNPQTEHTHASRPSMGGLAQQTGSAWPCLLTHSRAPASHATTPQSRPEQAAPAEGKRHISYTGPVQKGKEWLALGRLSAPIVTPPLKMEGAEELVGFLAELGAAE